MYPTAGTAMAKMTSAKTISKSVNPLFELLLYLRYPLMTLHALRKTPPLIENLPRFCNLLALGHFTASVMLELVSRTSAESPFLQFSILAIVVGVIMGILGLLTNLTRHWDVVAKFCFFLLFAEALSLLFIAKDLSHSIIMLLPILFLISVPILGSHSPYYLAALSSLYIVSLNFSGFVLHPLGWPDLSFRLLGFFIVANLSSFLWAEVFHKEKNLETALLALSNKDRQIENWVQKVVEATSLIDSSQMTLKFPKAPPYEAFTALGANLQHLQEKLGEYFRSLIVNDRLSSVGLLASGLAHELNTPLATLEFLIETKKEMLPADFKKGLEEEIRRMSGITRQFLSFASPNQKEEILDLNSVVKETLSHFKRLSPTLGIEAKLDLKPVLIQGTKNQLGQVLINIFRNSMMATQETANAQFHLETKINTMESVLILEDNGCGIEPCALTKIYDPFFTTKPPGKGTGLGLYIVREILERHRASLSVESTPHKGTRFVIAFPRVTSIPNSVKKAA